MEANPLEIWAAGKPSVLAAFGINAALAAEATCELLTWVRSGSGRRPRLQRRDGERWLEYYSNHRTFLADLGCALGWNPQRVARLLSAYRFLSWCTRAERVVVEATLRELCGQTPKGVYANATRFAELGKRLAADGICSPNDNGILGEIDWEALCRTSVGQFCFRVALPCWVLHGRWPGKVLCDATRWVGPDRTALDLLVGLDKQVIHHNRMQRFLHDGPASLQAGRQRRVGKALQRSTRRLSRKQIKFRIGRLIIDIAKALHVEVTSGDIRELFDAVGQVQKGLQRDADLPASPESHTKGLQRAKGFWLLPVVADMKR
ncbi:MAG: hypothetical protein CMJ58_28105 [Planctomycetaceae bacterium]|nr:hypothetical protein [Planctomycetaceae bacterium]